MKRSLRYRYFSAVLVALFVIFHASQAIAATLFFSPSSGNFSVGNILTTSIFVNTQGEVINNVDAIINFPTELLEVISVSKSGSIFSLWVEEPDFSNSAGTISFNGGVPTPGFNGAAGKIASVVFRVKSAGTASVLLSSAAVRANDGLGTDVLQVRGQAQFTLGAVKAPPPVEEKPADEPSASRSPRAPTLASATHPNQDAWYSNNNPSFNWSNGTDTTGVNVLADRKPTTNPGTNPDGLFSTYRYEDVDEGTWYFHVRLRNAKGWGDVSHFKFQIDTEKPESLVIKQVNSDDVTAKTLKFSFDATDKTSGIDYYQVGVDAADLQLWRDKTGDGMYEMPRPSAGKHTLNVRAVDKAGNYIAKSIDFTVTASNAPEITKYPKRVTSGDAVTIGGTAEPSAQVIIYLEREGDEAKPYITTSNESGSFTHRIEDQLPPGAYTVWAQSVSATGSKSELSEQVTIVVKPPFTINATMLMALIGSIGAVLVALVIILMVWVIRLRREVHALKRSVYGVSAVKDVVKSAAVLVRRRTPVKRKKIVRPPTDL